MIYPTVPFPVTLSDPLLRFQGHGTCYYRRPRRIVCGANAWSVCDS